MTITVKVHLVLGLNYYAESLFVAQVHMKFIVSPLLPQYLGGEGPSSGLKGVPA